ncbi:MAG: S9 family peptidase, partial [Elusimicrobia bacterium]|nr:S9 family peptidase [Elusimicrobiota bacterium]
SYGYSVDPNFSSNIIIILDRGFVYAIAHIRGGSEMGRAWYEDGRQDKKKNTFHDFIDATEALLTEGWIEKGRVYAMGESAGGLLMGAVANLRPDLYRGILAHVPFVDALTTMLDPTIPLTTAEYDEWGNPNDPRFYRYIKSYSPYDNVAATDYPAIYVETGYNDSQVQYWEPAKWVARLRALKTGSNPVLFRVEIEAGHSGRTGRFIRLEEVARNYAFIMMREGMSQ